MDTIRKTIETQLAQIGFEKISGEYPDTGSYIEHYRNDNLDLSIELSDREQD